MSSIAGIVTAVSLALILSGIFTMLAPKSSTKKAFNTVLCMFLLLMILTPFISGAELDFSLEEESASAGIDHVEHLNETLMQQLEQSASGQVEEQVKALLAGLEISSAKIRIIMDRNEDGRIQISQIDIFLDKEDLHLQDSVKKLVENHLGIPTNVYARQETE